MASSCTELCAAELNFFARYASFCDVEKINQCSARLRLHSSGCGKSSPVVTLESVELEEAQAVPVVKCDVAV